MSLQKTQKSSVFVEGFSTAATILTLAAAVIGVTAYIQWGGTGAGSAPTTDSVITAHQSVGSFQYTTDLTLDAQLDPAVLSERADAAQLRQALQYIPNAETETFPESLTGELTVNGSVSLASSTVENSESQIQLSLGTDELTEVLAVDWRVTDGTRYIRGQTLPNIGLLSLDQFEGRWYSASSSDSERLRSGSAASQLPSTVSVNQNISQATIRQLVQAMIDEGVIAVADKIRTELRSGAPAWQFQLGVNPEKVENYYQEAQRIVRENHPDVASSSALFANPSGAEEFQRSLEQFDTRVDEFSVWIYRSSDRIRRLVIEADLGEAELEEVAQNQSQLDGVSNATITLDVGLAAYNQSVDVEKPENAQPLQRIFDGASMMPAQPAAENGIQAN